MPENPLNTTESPQSARSHSLPSTVDAWLVGAVAIIVALCIALALIKPSGENWGRGWNMLAFWLYASPAAMVSGILALWRGSKARAWQKAIARLAGALGLAFPIICIIAMRMKA